MTEAPQRPPRRIISVAEMFVVVVILFDLGSENGSERFTVYL